MLGANCVLDEAGGEGLFECAQLTIGEAGRDHFHMKIPDLQRARGRLGLDANLQAFAGEAAQAEVLSDILADATAEGSEEEFGGGHALVGGPVFGRLVEQNSMVASFRCECGSAGVA